VVLLAGLQGAGKTTTAGKIARLLGSRSRPADVLLVSLDVYRPAAREQLALLAERTGARYFAGNSAEPVTIAGEALAEARRSGARWLIVDTAGRMHVDAAMMAEVQSVHAVLSPGETLFVVDAMAGQDALQSARAFHAALELTGVVLTKADGDARGGVALSVREATGIPIKLVGTGEKLDGLPWRAPAWGRCCKASCLISSRSPRARRGSSYPFGWLAGCTGRWCSPPLPRRSSIGPTWSRPSGSPT
jgi:signal recognition particle subunit SRP54